MARMCIFCLRWLVKSKSIFRMAIKWNGWAIMLIKDWG